MSVDLLALFNGKPASDRPGTARTSALSVAPAPAPASGGRATAFTAGAYTIKTPPPSPAFFISTTRDVLFASSFSRRLYGPDGSGRYYTEERASAPYAPGPAPAPGPTPDRPAQIPATFYVRPNDYTDGKTTADVAINERLYQALVRSTK